MDTKNAGEIAETIAKQLQAEVPGALIHISEPYQPTGIWQIHARTNDHDVTIGCRGDGHLGLSHDRDGTVFGEGWAELPTDASSAIRRAAELLKG